MKTISQTFIFAGIALALAGGIFALTVDFANAYGSSCGSCDDDTSSETWTPPTITTGGGNSNPPTCSISSSREYAVDGQSFKITWTGSPVSSDFWVNGFQLQDPNDAATYKFDGQYDYMRFTIYGENSDGNCGDEVKVYKKVLGCTDSDAVNYNSDATHDDNSCNYPVVGCTNSDATNYNPNATQSDNSCEYPVSGCTNPAATNYNPNATVNDNSCEYPDPEVQTSCKVFASAGTIDYDSSVTIRWETTGFDSIKLNGQTVSGNTGNRTFTNVTENTTYTLEATNSNGDTCVANVTVQCLPQVIPGCTDPAATNYNPNANKSNGSCVIPVPGCTDSTADNYNANATVNDNSCTYPVPGCTDSSATNYNANATVSNNSCEYPVGGCTDPTASNYNPDATTGDNSCVYPVVGCTNQYADNYNENATEDDNSCVFTPAPAAPVCEFTEQSGRTIVYFTGEKLRTDMGSDQSQTDAQTVSLASGDYAVSLMTWDGYKGRVNTSQPNEQWKLHFLNGDTIVAASNYSTDLADNVIEDQKTEQVNTSLTIPGAVTAVRGVQPYFPNAQFANSLYPICAAIDLVPQTPTTPVVNGCTDSDATNYDADATHDDNSCEYETEEETEEEVEESGTTSTSSGGGGSSSRPRCELEASDTTITAGDTVTLTWETRSTNDITLTNDRGATLITTTDRLSSDKRELLDYSIELKPRQDTVYTLVAERGSRDQECTVEIEVAEDLIVLESRDQAPLVAGISLDTVPYTGFEAGTIMTMFFYTLLAAWALYLTYVLVVPKTATAVAGVSLMSEHVSEKVDSPLAAMTMPTYVASTATAVAPTNLPVAPEMTVAPVAPTMAATTTGNVPVEVAALEAVAHNNQALLSSDAVKTFILNVPTEEQLEKIVAVVNEAKTQFPLEDGWVVINNDRMLALLTA